MKQERIKRIKENYNIQEMKGFPITCFRITRNSLNWHWATWNKLNQLNNEMLILQFCLQFYPINCLQTICNFPTHKNNQNQNQTKNPTQRYGCIGERPEEKTAYVQQSRAHELLGKTERAGVVSSQRTTDTLRVFKQIHERTASNFQIPVQISANDKVLGKHLKTQSIVKSIVKQTPLQGLWPSHC